MMMILLKMARLQHRPDFYDSWLDIAGYAACGYDVAAVDTTTIAELLDQKISAAATTMAENFSATIWATPQTPDMNRGPYWKEVVNEDAKPEDNFFLDTYPTSQWQHLDRSEPWDE
jgi:hypothetical protein